MSQEIEVVIQRDSVSMGDDIQAPHAYRVWISSQTTIEACCTELNLHLYLPKIVTGEAVWTVENAQGDAMLLIAQQWADLYYFVPQHSLLLEHLIFDETHQAYTLYLRYHMQIDPQLLIQQLESLKTDSTLK
ncbi:hypothetical protein [Acinetobacter lanii]|uniref:Uncharacterized protein n=1 Tax=Acinetobacter lanii TaxID=2715163 RepID=A0A6G8S1T5_9GAMM|nr:hypothetical protein [Acinetobacter lanii]QIO08085.1 hypothetical protein G8D99_02955 [Acinetobacter lanii]